MGILFGLFMIIIGAVNALFPETGWHMSEGWKFKNAEPSEEALLWGRLGGIVCIVIGIVLIFRS